MAERAGTGWAESPIDIGIPSAEDGLMAMMGPAGILLFARPPERTRPETQAQLRQPRNVSRIEAVIRTFRRRRRSHPTDTKSAAPTAATSRGQATGRIATQGRPR
jgi:hypothetical protein